MSARFSVVDALGMAIAVNEWGPPDGEPVVFLHGFLDHGRSFFKLGQLLSGGFRVIAPDFRGHGKSGWAPAGSYYHFYDYFMDTKLVLDTLVGERPVHLCGHSMGGSVATGFAAAFPRRIRKLVLIEGLGIPGATFDDAPGRVTTWIDSVIHVRSKVIRPMPDLNYAAERLLAQNGRMTREFALTIAKYGTRTVEQGLVWSFDPMQRTRSPKPYYLDEYKAFWKKLPTGTLHVLGGDSPFKLPDFAERIACFDSPHVEVLPKTGHNPHHDAAEALAALLFNFLS
ncbi:MAG: alpha/beta hydrolase [Myxococcales bacterium]|nr:alpha/beta hydrolase [Myxococcales bacterium]